MQKKHFKKGINKENDTGWIFFSWCRLRNQEKNGRFFLIKAGIEPAGRLLKQPLILE